jgi:two-component system phosphate regulon sensor histidine kinase PhoR
VRVRNVLADLKAEFTEAFRKKNVALEIEMPEENFTIRTDRIKFKEIFRNLLENARKFTVKGKVEMRWLYQPEDALVKFTVTDTGIGIKKELLPKIFDLFYQAPQGIETEAFGVGLGLSIVKRLVTTLSGEIEVTSEVGKGTSFQVTFPVEIDSIEPISFS